MFLIPTKVNFDTKNKGMTDQQVLERVMTDIQEKKGCRMKGFFEIDRVPGNFHFSSHGYNRIIPQLVNSGYSN